MGNINSSSDKKRIIIGSIITALIALFGVIYSSNMEKNIDLAIFESQVAYTKEAETTKATFVSEATLSPKMTKTNTIYFTSTPTAIPPTNNVELGDYFVVVGGGFKDLQHAIDYLKSYELYEFQGLVFIHPGNDIRAVLYGFTSEADAMEKLPKILSINNSGMIRPSSWCVKAELLSDHINCY